MISMIYWRKRIFYAISASFIIITLSTSWASAANTSLTQKILPLNCVFQIINDGTGTIYYITPRACGVVMPTPPTDHTIPNPPVDTPIITPDNPTRTGGFITLTENSNSILPTSVVSSSQPIYSMTWRPLIATTGNQSKAAQLSPPLEQAAKQSNTTAAIVISATAIVFLIIIIVL